VHGAIRLSCLVSASLALVAWPAAASAATVKLSGPWLLYEAAPGEVNDLTTYKR
jgi:hypothetical protein